MRWQGHTTTLYTRIHPTHIYISNTEIHTHIYKIQPHSLLTASMSMKTCPKGPLLGLHPLHCTRYFSGSSSNTSNTLMNRLLRLSQCSSQILFSSWKRSIQPSLPRRPRAQTSLMPSVGMVSLSMSASVRGRVMSSGEWNWPLFYLLVDLQMFI